MQMFGKIVNDEIQYAPAIYNTPDGNKIINFNKNEKFMRKYGFLPVENIMPKYNKETEECYVVGYDVTDEKIVVLYEVWEAKSSFSGRLTLEERVSRLEYKMNSQETIFDDTINE